MSQKELNTSWVRSSWPQIALAAGAIALLLTTFNAYYFFFRRGVGPGYYIEKFLAQEYRAVEQEPPYRAITEAYLHFNIVQGDAPVHVFIGDSNTAGFQLHEFKRSGSRSVLNRGINSDTTNGLLGRIETNVNNLTVENLFVMIGYNDLDRRADDEITRNIEKILDLAKAERKYVQSLLPVDSSIDARKNARIAAINQRLLELCRKKGYTFIDLHARFAEDGAMKPGLTYDGLHPNYFGYKLWFSIIQPYLDEE